MGITGCCMVWKTNCFLKSLWLCHVECRIVFALSICCSKLFINDSHSKGCGVWHFLGNHRLLYGLENQSFLKSLWLCYVEHWIVSASSICRSELFINDSHSRERFLGENVHLVPSTKPIVYEEFPMQLSGERCTGTTSPPRNHLQNQSFMKSLEFHVFSTKAFRITHGATL